MILSPRRLWPGLLLIVFPIHLLAQAQLGVTWTMASLHYVCDCGLLLLTAEALYRARPGLLELNELRQALLFLEITAAAVAVATLIWSPLFVRLFVGGARPSPTLAALTPRRHPPD